MADPAIINGNLPSWSSITIKIGERRINGVTAISYGDSRERTKGYGTGKSHAPIGETGGVYSTKPCTMTLYKHTAAEVRQALADEAGTSSFGNTRFEISVSYSETGLPAITDTIKGCKISDQNSSNDNGGDPTSEDMEFSCMSIKWNGLTLHEEN